MKFEFWYLTFGALLVVAALMSSLMKRLPMTGTMLYLGIGILLGPTVLHVAELDPVGHKELLERTSEFVVIVSLFTAGLKLRAPFRDGRWHIPLRLASVSMMVTVGLVALVGFYGFGLSLGAAVLLGAVLAPTDPVLASDVQLESAQDRDRLRFSLTGEAGSNDGSAFPFVMLGLGLMGMHELGEFGWRWFVVDVLWSTIGGLSIGSLLGIFIGRTVLHLRHHHNAGMGREEFLTLGLIAVSYGAALAAHTYGFLAVFAAGLALRRIERNETETPLRTAQGAPNGAEKNNRFKKTTVQLTDSVLNFNEQLERLLEIALVLLVGIMLTSENLQMADFWFVPVLLLVIRPVAVYLGLLGAGVPRHQMLLISWFGIRGIGSIYYLTYAFGHGLPSELSRQLASITLWTIATSIVVHGISVTPLMDRYQRFRKQSNRSRTGEAGADVG